MSHAKVHAFCSGESWLAERQEGMYFYRAKPEHEISSEAAYE